MKTHLIFHISLLKLAPKNTIIITPRLDIKVYEEDYKPEKIINKKRINREIKYLVKWKEYKDKDNT
jgi:hypothetical protein